MRRVSRRRWGSRARRGGVGVEEVVVVVVGSVGVGEEEEGAGGCRWRRLGSIS